MPEFNIKFVQNQVSQLAGAGVSIGDNEVTVTKFEQIDGTPLTMDNFGIKGYLTIEPGSGQNEEQVSFTGIVVNIDGTTTLTGIFTVLNVYPYTETANFAMDHAGGVNFVVSNTAGFYNTFANKNDEGTINVVWTFTRGKNPKYDLHPVSFASTDLIDKQALDTVEADLEAEIAAGDAATLAAAEAFALSLIPGASPNITALADENITVGTPVGISNASTGIKVARANKISAASNALDFTANLTSLNQYHVAQMDANTFVQLGTQTSDTSLRCFIVTVNNTTNSVTLGASAIATTAANISGTTLLTLCKLDTNKFIIFYIKNTDTIFAKVGNISGTTITFGVEQTVGTPGNTPTTIISSFSSTNKAIVTAVLAAGAASQAIPLTVSSGTGTTVTGGTLFSFSGTMDDTTGIENIDIDKFIFTNATGFAQIGSVTANVLTVGTAVQFETDVLGVDYNTLVSPSSNVVIIAYNVSTASFIIMCTVSGTVPSFGSRIATGASGNQITLESSTTIVSGITTRTRISFSGITLTPGPIIMQTSFAIAFFITLTGYYVGVAPQAGSGGDIISLTNMANNYIGFAQQTVAKGASINVFIGGFDGNQSGLIAGGKYLISNGTLSFVASNASVSDLSEIDVVVALSPTQVKI